MVRRLQGKYNVEDKWERQKAKQRLRADEESAAFDAAHAKYAPRLQREDVKDKCQTKDERQRVRDDKASATAALFDTKQPPK